VRESVLSIRGSFPVAGGFLAGDVGADWTEMTNRRACFLCALLIPLWLFGLAPYAEAQSATAKIDYNPSTRVFRIAAADVSYLFGVNEHESCKPSIGEAV